MVEQSLPLSSVSSVSGSIPGRGVIILLHSMYLLLQDNTVEWLSTLQMEEYIDVFHSAGYKTGEDVENLKELSEKEMRKMGINKMGEFI